MTYGPNTEAVQSIINCIPTLTKDEVNRLGATWSAARRAAWSTAKRAARDEAGSEARDEAWGEARDEAWGATWNEAWSEAKDATRYAAWGAAIDALLATVTYDLATETGPYTIARRDLLLAPWVEVCGMPT